MHTLATILVRSAARFTKWHVCMLCISWSGPCATKEWVCVGWCPRGPPRITSLDPARADASQFARRRTLVYCNASSTCSL